MCAKTVAKKGVRLVVFDFDNTLSTVHVFKSLAGCNVDPLTGKAVEFFVPSPHALTEEGQMRRIAELSESEFKAQGGFAQTVFGGSARVEDVRALLCGLREEGTELVVCTKGLVGPVSKILDSLELLSYFSQVYGNIGCKYGANPYDLETMAAEAAEETLKLVGSDEQGDWTSKAELISKLMRSKGLSRDQCVLVEDDPKEIRRAARVCRTIHVTEAAGVTKEHASALLRMAEKVEVRKMFEQFDANSDGSIDLAELGEVLQWLDSRAWSDTEVEQVFRKMDFNKDNKIQYREFVEWIYST
eukprot:TRINITY_DN32467_c0_g1_i1.p1 TRINITY_DN32467_c0_g1~~TRINITY_DN32467_c0_g1_i1.p1  ORF type:complete len:301 (-),score=58.73 TRINITY_DN32467_c0_g1_i1:99-1001(-)